MMRGGRPRGATLGYASTPLGRVLLVTAGHDLLGLFFDRHARSPSVSEAGTAPQRDPRHGSNAARRVLPRAPNPFRPAAPAGGHALSARGVVGAARYPVRDEIDVLGRCHADRTSTSCARGGCCQWPEPHLHHRPLPPSRRSRRRSDRLRRGNRSQAEPSGARGRHSAPVACRPALSRLGSGQREV